MNGQVSEGASEGLFPASEPSLVREPSLPRGLCPLQSTCHLRDCISETHLEKDKLGPGGAVSLCPCPWEAEKGEEEEKEEQWEGWARLQKAISREWEITSSV